jgi:hypothetical protein
MDAAEQAAPRIGDRQRERPTAYDAKTVTVGAMTRDDVADIVGWPRLALAGDHVGIA